MSNPKFKPISISFTVIITIVIGLIFPLRVLADEGTPTEEPAEVVETSTPLPGGEDESVAEMPPAEGTASLDVPLTVDVPGTDPVLEIVVESPGEPALAEMISSMDEAGLLLVDSSGEAIPFTTELAEAALLAPDPIGCPPGVQPVTWGGTGVGCTISYANIQDAINDASVVAGWTIYVDPGTFNENVVVGKSVTLQGSGMGVTIIRPAISNPNCGGGGGGSLCVGSSNVILVRADDVTIRDLTIDGNNPALTSGVTSNGVDVDARNGIITDHTDPGLGTLDGLTVFNVEVENIYLRGIYASDSGTFNIHDNVVDNVAGEFASIALFNFGGSGIFSNNKVSNSNDGIAANWSTGTQFLNNTVTNSGSGIHTDNTQAADVISGNTISNGPADSYGIFVFAPYDAVTVSNNTITNVDVGLALSGNGWGDSLNTITFSNNKVVTNAIGAYVTTDVWGYFFADTSAVFTGNVFTGGDYGFYLESNGAGEYYGSYDCSGAGGDCILNVTGSGNSITGQNLFAATIAEGQLNWFNNTPAYYGEYNVDLRGNWWGQASGPKDSSPVPDSCGITLDNPTGLGGNVSKCILYDLWLSSNPFPTASTSGGTQQDAGTQSLAIRSQAVPLSCDLDKQVISVGEVQVIFSGLCGFRVILEPLGAAQVQPGLGEGTFLFGVRIVLLQGDVVVNALPAGASVVISFPAADGIPMHWTGSWSEIAGTLAGGRIEVQGGPGDYILISK